MARLFILVFGTFLVACLIWSPPWKVYGPEVPQRHPTGSYRIVYEPIRVIDEQYKTVAAESAADILAGTFLLIVSVTFICFAIEYCLETTSVIRNSWQQAMIMLGVVAVAVALYYLPFWQPEFKMESGPWTAYGKNPAKEHLVWLRYTDHIYWRSCRFAAPVLAGEIGVILAVCGVLVVGFRYFKPAACPIPPGP